MEGKIPGKRRKSIIRSTESDLTPPDLKRHISILTRHYYENLKIETAIERDSSSDTEN